MNRHLRVTVNLDAIRKNFSLLKRILRRTSPSPLVIGVVKADAYGHGAVEVAKVLEDAQIDFLATAYLEEAIELREAGIKAPIIVLFEEPDIPRYIKYDLRAVVHNEQTVRGLERSLKVGSPPLKIHIEFDTGMGRLGFSPGDAIKIVKRVLEIKGLRLEGIMSHFSSAELTDKESATEQINIFRDISTQIERLLGGLIYHISNSAGVFNLPEAWFSAVRPGLLLYGYLPGGLEDKELSPAMKVSTRLLTIRRIKAGTPISYGGTFITRRESLVGIISAGYADGFMRGLSNRGYVLFRGRRAPVIGRVCMDLTMVDLTDIIDSGDKVSPTEEVVILGKQGDEIITAKEIALWAQTIPYEVLTTFGGLGKREFIDEKDH